MSGVDRTRSQFLGSLLSKGTAELDPIPGIHLLVGRVVFGAQGLSWTLRSGFAVVVTAKWWRSYCVQASQDLTYIPENLCPCRLLLVAKGGDPAHCLLFLWGGRISTHHTSPTPCQANVPSMVPTWLSPNVGLNMGLEWRKLVPWSVQEKYQARAYKGPFQSPPWKKDHWERLGGRYTAFGPQERGRTQGEPGVKSPDLTFRRAQ